MDETMFLRNAHRNAPTVCERLTLTYPNTTPLTYRMIRMGVGRHQISKRLSNHKFMAFQLLLSYVG